MTEGDMPSSLARELRATMAVYFTTIIGGYNIGLSAVVIPDILREQKEVEELSLNQNSTLGSEEGNLRWNSSFNLPVVEGTNEDLSWFASCVNIGMFLGGLLGGYCGGRFGPRRTILFFCGPAILSWLAIALAPNLPVLIVGRILAGTFSSVNTANSSMLVAQYASTPRRGVFLSLFALMIGLGVLLCYTLGLGLAWRPICLVVPVLLLVNMCFLFPLPESPAWLMGHRGAEEATLALEWLRGSKQVEEEAAQLALTREQQSSGVTLTQALTNLMRRSDVAKPFFLVFANFLFVMFAGPFAMIFYGVQIFQETGVNAHMAAVVVAILRVVGGLVALVLIKKLPRVRLAMATMTLMSLSMAILGAVLYLKDKGAEGSTVLRVVPVLCVLVYMFSYGAGAGPLQFVFLGELLPPDYKVLSGIIIALGALSIFVVTKAFPSILASSIGAPGAYWMFSFVALSSNLFYALCMPETKELSLLGIKQIFTKTTADIMEDTIK